MEITIKKLDGKLLTSEDAARELNVSSSRVRQLEKEGKIQAARTVSGVRIFLISDVAKLAKDRKG